MWTTETEKIINTRFREGTLTVLITDQVQASDRVIVTDKTRYLISESVNHCKIVLDKNQIDSLLNILMRMKVCGKI